MKVVENADVFGILFKYCRQAAMCVVTRKSLWSLLNFWYLDNDGRNLELSVYAPKSAQTAKPKTSSSAAQA